MTSGAGHSLLQITASMAACLGLLDIATPVCNTRRWGCGKRPVILGDADAIAVRSMVYLSLSFDHRVMDGAHADAFLHKVKDILETWGESLYEQKKPNPPGGYGGVW